MRALYAIAAVTVLLGLGIAYNAKVRLDDAHQLRAQTTRTTQEIAGLEAEQHSLEAVQDILPVKFQADALSEFVSRTIEAGEVLGGGVRIAGSPYTFREIKHGLQVASVVVSTAAERDAAPALLSLLEDEIGNLPAVVRKASARVTEKFVTIELSVDIYGR